jgi:hypothetical protein
MRKILIFLLIIFCAQSIFAFDYASNLITFDTFSLDMRIDNGDVFFMDRPPVGEYSLNLDPVFIFNALSVSDQEASSITVSLQPVLSIQGYNLFDFTLNEFGFTLNADFYNEFYFDPGSRFSLGVVSVFGLSNFDYSTLNETIDFEAYSSFALTSGRLYDQGFVVQARTLAGSLKVQISDEKLLIIADYLAKNRKKYFAISDESQKEFISGLAALLGIPYQKLSTLYAYRKLSDLTSFMQTGTRFNINVNSVYSQNSQSIFTYTEPMITFAWHKNDYIWYQMQPSIYVPIFTYLLKNQTFYWTDINSVDLNLRSVISWFPSATTKINLNIIGHWVNFIDVTQFLHTFNVYTKLTAEFELFDNFQIRIETPLTEQIHYMAIDFGVSAKWQLY